VTDFKRFNDNNCNLVRKWL